LAQRISFFLIKQRADLIIVDNHLLQDELVALGFDPSKVFVNYPGIKLGYLKAVKRRKKVGYDGVYMAQLRPVKGIFDLIKIWKLVCYQKPDSRLGIIGQGLEDTVKKLKSLIKTEALEKNINLLGYLEDDEAFAVIKASKVFVFPSHEEGFGLAPLEAQACGLPVVAWHIPAYDEVFQEGMVKVKIGKVEKFANEVVKLLTNKRLHRLLAKKAISNSGRYNWHQVAQKELKLIQKVNQ
jgi:glycosyltransferase involved in cell wall biosynthesis